MKRKQLFISILVATGLIAFVFFWNASQLEIIVDYPQPNDVVNYRFAVAGAVPIPWIEGPGFSADVFIEDESHFLYGQSILGHLIFVKVPWWKKIVGGTVGFYDVLDTGGYYGDAVYKGPATLVLSSLYTSTTTRSISIPIYIDLEKF